MSTGMSLVDSSFSVPVIDIGPWTTATSDVESNEESRLLVAKAVGDACREVGFFAIINHHVDETIVENAWQATTEFFDLPLDLKLQYKSTSDAEYPYGYENSEVLSLGKQYERRNQQDDSTQLPPPPDLKETFAIGPDNPHSGMPQRQWPKEPIQLQSALSDYYVAMEKLSWQLLEILATALDLPNPHDWVRHNLDHHSSALRILNYFPCQKSQLRQGQLRASAHTDYGVLTILKSGGPGLQLQKDSDNNNNLDDGWVDVPFLPNAFIINLGDMMRRWTNDEWLSTLHRVVVTEEDAKRRQSIAYFCNVNGDCLVDPRDLRPNQTPKHAPILARDHLIAKHLASMGVLEDPHKHGL